MSKTVNDLSKFLNYQLLHRYNQLKDFNKIMSEFLGFDVEFKDLTQETYFVDDRIGVNLLIDENDIYVDVFYIIDNDGNMVITEYNVDYENVLKDDDYKKAIKGVLDNE